MWFLVAVMVYAPPPGNARRGEVQAAVERAVGENLDPHALRAALAERSAGWVRQGELNFFAAAHEKAEEGRRLLERVELDAADSAFGEAEKIYEAHLPWPGVPSLWSEVALWRGVAAFERGQVPLARKLFQRAVALDPTAKLTEASARPDVVRAFSDAQKPRARFKLSVPEGVLVDGRPPTPDVQAGEHVVTARGEGHLPVALLVEVAGPLEVELTAPVDPIAAQLESLKQAPNADALRTLIQARSLEGAYVVAAGVDAGTLALVGERIDPSGCATSPATSSSAASLIDQLERAPTRCPSQPEEILSAQPIAHPRPAPIVVIEKPRPPPRKKKLWERPWIWVGVLAVTTAGIAVGAALAPSTTSYKATVEGSAFSIR